MIAIDACWLQQMLSLIRIGPSMFEAEALGLSAMYATQSIRVPMPYKSGTVVAILLTALNKLVQVMPKQPGFEKRRDLYMLYHYLNHYNLFGSGYRSSAMSIIDDYLRMLEV
ncbi:hypothetical protein MUK42_18001 [Musa troglodytarum]|uniref:Uncharacterized protein n=1 Tax=Musa troglodytarum TaxID=320322 RepID=A0A9E7I064_9LILI|nr:hypothetical protein MUK42_18001 [Musa troglodytarum]